MAQQIEAKTLTTQLQSRGIRVTRVVDEQHRTVALGAGGAASIHELSEGPAQLARAGGEEQARVLDVIGNLELTPRATT